MSHILYLKIKKKHFYCILSYLKFFSCKYSSCIDYLPIKYFSELTNFIQYILSKHLQFYCNHHKSFFSILENTRANNTVTFYLCINTKKKRTNSCYIQKK